MKRRVWQVMEAGRYPMLWIVLSFMCGIFCHNAFEFDGGLWWGIVVVIVALGVIFDILLKRSEPLLLCIVAIGGFLASSLREPKLPENLKYNQQSLFVGVLESRVESIGEWQRSEMKLLAVRDSLGRWNYCNVGVIARVDSSMVVQRGDTVALIGRLREVAGGYGDYLTRRGYLGQIYGYRPEIIGRDYSTGLLDRVQDSAIDRLRSLDTLGSQAVAAISAMVVGRRDMLNRASVESYRDVGAAHLLAISGLHIGIIVVLLNLIFGWVKLWNRGGRVLFSIVVILGLWSYALFSGMAISVQRAVIMFTLYQLAVMIGRSGISINILASSAFIVLLINPLSLYDIGFQLSYSAMVGISILCRPLISVFSLRYRILRLLWGAFAVSISAQLFVMPLVVYYFEQLQWFSLLLFPVVWFSMPVIIFSTVIYLLSGVGVIGYIAVEVASWQNHLFVLVAGNEWVVVKCPELPLWLLVVIYGVLIVMSHWFASSMNRRSRYSMLRRRMLGGGIY